MAPGQPGFLQKNDAPALALRVCDPQPWMKEDLHGPLVKHRNISPLIADHIGEIKKTPTGSFKDTELSPAETKHRVIHGEEKLHNKYMWRECTRQGAPKVQNHREEMCNVFIPPRSPNSTTC